MKKILFLIIPLIAFSSFFVNEVKAGAGDNVFGWAWSENIGWISFNSINCDANGDGLSDGSPAGCPVAGTAMANYGVNINASGNFSGYSWSENIGWISFDKDVTGAPPAPIPPCDEYGDIDDDGYVTNADASMVLQYVVKKINLNDEQKRRADVNLDGKVDANDGMLISQYINGTRQTFIPCGTAKVPLAKLNFSNQKVYGWVRALAYGGGWDGWIKLRGTAIDGSPYGVSVDKQSGEFQGFAWSDMVVGWINFKGVKTTFSLNSPPDKPTKVGEGEVWNNCAWGSTPQVADGLSVTFNWTYSDLDGDESRGYEIEVGDDSGFPSGKERFNHIVDLTTTSTSYTLDLSQDDSDNDGDSLKWISELAWDTNYFWRVRVKDSRGAWSDWSNSDGFRTPDHAYPDPDFSWSPENPNQKEVVIFDSVATNVYYRWTFNQGVLNTYEPADGTTETSEEPHIKFLISNNTVKLKVTDKTDSNYYCESKPPEGRSLEALMPLPEYKETSPIIWLKKALAGLYNFIFF